MFSICTFPFLLNKINLSTKEIDISYFEMRRNSGKIIKISKETKKQRNKETKKQRNKETKKQRNPRGPPFKDRKKI